MTWSRVEVKSLINLYKEHPCLYELTDKNYRNRNIRTAALATIHKQMCRIRPGTSIGKIKCKFNNLRTNFLTHHKKYVQSRLNQKQVSKPHIWYYDSMKFLVEPIKTILPNEPADTIELDSVVQDDITDAHPSEISESIDVKSENQDAIDASETSMDIGEVKKIRVYSSHYLAPANSIESNEIIDCESEKAVINSCDIRNDNFMETLSNSLGQIGKILQANITAAATAETDKKAVTQSEIFGSFISKQLSFIEDIDEELFLDVQNQIYTILHEARKKFCSKKKNFR